MISLIPPTETDPRELISPDSPASAGPLSIQQSSLITHPRTRRQIREFIIRDTVGNYYVTYLFIASRSGSEYQFPSGDKARVKPSAIAKAGGRINADILDTLRASAFRSLIEADSLETREYAAISHALAPR